MSQAFTGAEYVHYLWHLHKAGVIGIDPPPVPDKTPLKEITQEIDTTIWDEQLPKSDEVGEIRVALIDNGANLSHANLPRETCLVDPIDLATHPFGAVYPLPKHGGAAQPSDAATDPAFREERVKHFAGVGALVKCLGLLDIFKDGPRRVVRLLERLADETDIEGVRRQLSSYDQEFARHGTLTAGVIGARAPTTAGSDALAYFGADPMCRIVPINTPFSPGFRELCLALLYARLKGADLICMPRGATPPEAMQPSPEEDPEDGDGAEEEGVEARSARGRPGSRNRTNDPRLSRLTRRDDPFRALFEHLLVAISRDIPVVLAGGNDGRGDLAYPASLASPVGAGAGKNGIIAVGAVNGGDHRASYSSGWQDPRLTVYAPSDDEEQLHAEDRRFDGLGDRPNDHNLGAVEGSSDRYVGWTVLSTDVPGLFGESIGDVVVFGKPGRPARSSLYAAFGGTSAAAAIVTGVLALALRQIRIDAKTQGGGAVSPTDASRVSSVELKALLRSTGRRTCEDAVRVVDARALLRNIRPIDGQ